MTVRAYILVKTAVSMAAQVQEELGTKSKNTDEFELTDIDLVAGDDDMVVVVDASDPKYIGELVVKVIHNLPGVLGTRTLLKIG